MTKPIIRILTRGLLAAALSAGGLFRVNAAEASTPIAKIGETEVGAEEIRLALGGLDERERAAVAKDPSLLNQVVRSMLVQRLVLKQAIAEKWDQKPDVAAQIERVRRSTITEAYLHNVAEKSGAVPSEADLRQAYGGAKDSLFVPKQFQLAQIFISVSAGAAKDVEAKAKVKVDSVTKSLASVSADFAAVARLNSDETATAAKGGEIGWLTEKQIQPEILAKVSGLSKGAVSSALRLPDGWHILKVLDVKDGYTPSFEEVRDRLEEKVHADRLRATTQAYLSKLLQENPVVINELALSKLVEATKP